MWSLAPTVSDNRDFYSETETLLRRSQNLTPSMVTPRHYSETETYSVVGLLKGDLLRDRFNLLRDRNLIRAPIQSETVNYRRPDGWSRPTPRPISMRPNPENLLSDYHETYSKTYSQFLLNHGPVTSKWYTELVLTHFGG